jgi:hypothetical protein
MKYILPIFIFIPFSAVAQDRKLEPLFFDAPLMEPRDSICNYFIQSPLFTEFKDSHKVSQNGVKINTYSGYLKTQLPELAIYKIDSVHIDVSTGGMRSNKDTVVKYLIPISAYYYFSGKKSAKRFFDRVEDQLTQFTGKRIPRMKIFEKDKYVVCEVVWNNLSDSINQLEARCTKLDKGKFEVVIEYVRLE